MLIADKWQDYELLDAGDGEKLERWGDALLLRPDPQAIWPAGAALERTPGPVSYTHLDVYKRQYQGSANRGDFVKAIAG